MQIKKQKVELTSEKQIDFIDITLDVTEIVRKFGIQEGQVLIFSPHTTAGVVLNHNESMLLQDISRMLYKLVPIDEHYGHDMFELTRENKSDGRSNGHSHCKNILIGSSTVIPLAKGEMMLGEKQSIFFVDLDGGRKRDFIVQVMGE